MNVISTYLLALLLFPTLGTSATKYNITPRLTIVGSEVHELATFSEQKYDDIFEALRDKSKSSISDRSVLILPSSSNPIHRWLNQPYLRYTSQNSSLLTTRELAARANYPDQLPISLNTVNPGWCHSDLNRGLPLLMGPIVRAIASTVAHSTEVGSRKLVFAVETGREGEEMNGRYVSDCRVGK